MPFRDITGHHGKTMQSLVKNGPMSTGSNSTPNPSTLSPTESAQNYKIAANMRVKSFMGNVYTRYNLPHDTAQSQSNRANEFFRQSAMPWLSAFMVTSTDAQRLNNPAQTAFVNQRQLTIPNTYGQFYAFMHALSAAFGNLQSKS